MVIKNSVAFVTFNIT